MNWTGISEVRALALPGFIQSTHKVAHNHLSVTLVPENPSLASLDTKHRTEQHIHTGRQSTQKVSGSFSKIHVSLLSLCMGVCICTEVRTQWVRVSNRPERSDPLSWSVTAGSQQRWVLRTKLGLSKQQVFLTAEWSPRPQSIFMCVGSSRICGGQDFVRSPDSKFADACDQCCELTPGPLTAASALHPRAVPRPCSLSLLLITWKLLNIKKIFPKKASLNYDSSVRHICASL